MNLLIDLIKEKLYRHIRRHALWWMAAVWALFAFGGWLARGCMG